TDQAAAGVSDRQTPAAHTAATTAAAAAPPGSRGPRTASVGDVPSLGGAATITFASAPAPPSAPARSRGRGELPQPAPLRRLPSRTPRSAPWGASTSSGTATGPSPSRPGEPP